MPAPGRGEDAGPDLDALDPQAPTAPTRSVPERDDGARRGWRVIAVVAGGGVALAVAAGVATWWPRSGGATRSVRPTASVAVSAGCAQAMRAVADASPSIDDATTYALHEATLRSCHSSAEWNAAYAAFGGFETPPGGGLQSWCLTRSDPACSK